ncbi:MAG: hypothetical protein KJP17_05030 [Gammaproteobacteria bacterium]|nr:hypothetical protein [Gammaproteobacteria bacterium]
MLKTFFIGVLLGLAAAAGTLYAVPAVDQVREASIVSVAPNGGTIETFRINVPTDRVAIGAAGQSAPVPPGLDWPDDLLLAYSRTELFKIRNARDAVIGVAVRNAAEGAEAVTIDWVLHLPARGSFFVNMESAPRDGGYRLGEIRSGSREFAPMSGFMTERWVENDSDEEDAPRGHIELVTTYVSELQPEVSTEVGE